MQGTLGVGFLSCYHPIIAYRYKVVNPGGRYGQPQHLIFRPNYEDFVSGRLQPVPLPCGKCLGCRMDYSRQWANRCLMEMQYHESTMFLTLTYDDAHLPRTFTADPGTGEVISPAATLVPRDFTLFIKRLRKRFSDQTLRLFGCGEYGSQTFRPHYHIIVFGLSLSDMEPYKQSQLGDQYFTSPSLDACWTASDGSPKGFIVAAPANWQTCAYVARYILKKQTGADGKRDYKALGIEPPFVRMSRRPGLGYQWFQDHPDAMQYSQINVSTVDGGRSFPPPAYFKRLYKSIDPVSADWYAIERSTAAENNAEIQQKLLTDLDGYDILQLQQGKLQKKVRLLRRQL